MIILKQSDKDRFKGLKDYRKYAKDLQTILNFAIIHEHGNKMDGENNGILKIFS